MFDPLGKDEQMWTYQYFKDKSGQWRWRLVAGNGRKVAVSGESFSSRAHAERAARNVKMNAGSAAVPEMSSDYLLGQALRRVAQRQARKKAIRARF